MPISRSMWDRVGSERGADGSASAAPGASVPPGRRPSAAGPYHTDRQPGHLQQSRPPTDGMSTVTAADRWPPVQRPTAKDAAAPRVLTAPRRIWCRARRRADSGLPAVQTVLFARVGPRRIYWTLERLGRRVTCAWSFHQVGGGHPSVVSLSAKDVAGRPPDSGGERATALADSPGG